MNLTFEKTKIIDQFLVPISKVATDCSLSITNKTIQSLVTDSNGSTILFAKLDIDNYDIPDNKTINLNIKEIRKLIRVFECIGTDIFTVEVDDNISTLKFKSTDMSFKLHLVLDEAIKKCSLSLSKIEKLNFNTEFILTNTKLSEILKGSTFATETNKVYFFIKDKTVYAELTDKTTEQIDSITYNISDQYTGENLAVALPFSLEILRLLSGIKTNNTVVKINNTYKIIMFEINNPCNTMKLIVPAFVK